jgi:hypothetical protein
MPAFEGPEFQPNVILQKASAKRGSGVEVFKSQQSSELSWDAVIGRVYMDALPSGTGVFGNCGNAVEARR